MVGGVGGSVIEWGLIRESGVKPENNKHARHKTAFGAIQLELFPIQISS
jgi:hypothetical protein